MTTAIIGTGKIGSTVARELAAGGEPVRLVSRRWEDASDLAAAIGGLATADVDTREAVEGANHVVLAVWLDSMHPVIDGIADLLPGMVVIDPSNPIAVSADGKLSRTLPKDQSAGSVVAGWLPNGARFAKAFGTLGADDLAGATRREPESAVLFYATDDDIAAAKVERLISCAGFAPVKAGGMDACARIEFGGDLNSRILSPDQAKGLIES
jgi:predicted dinucleotide-binding enzyme